MVHQLKCWPEEFGDLLSRRKTFEVRRGEDRVYGKGDTLRLQEWDPAIGEYTGREIHRIVTHVMHGGPWIPADMWILSLTIEDEI
jgi:hypothetical protein